MIPTVEETREALAKPQWPAKRTAEWHAAQDVMRSVARAFVDGELIAKQDIDYEAAWEVVDAALNGKVELTEQTQMDYPCCLEPGNDGGDTTQKGSRNNGSFLSG